MSLLHRFLWVVVFAGAFAWVEASVVVYLRDLYYPLGFAFPLKVFPQDRLSVELIREFSTLAMLAAVGMLAGSTRWGRIAWFAIAFGAWDIFFYLWLKLGIDWPSSLFEWDILFLLPLPWIGPVIAPIAISFFLIISGLLLLRYEREQPFRPPVSAWVLGAAGTALALWSFMSDTDATLRGALPGRYPYELLGAGLACLTGALRMSLRRPSRS